MGTEGAHPGYYPERMVRNGQKLEEIRLSRLQSRAGRREIHGRGGGGKELGVGAGRNWRGKVFIYLFTFFPPPPAREFRTFPHRTAEETIISPRVFGRFRPFFWENILGGLPVLWAVRSLTG